MAPGPPQGLDGTKNASDGCVNPKRTPGHNSAPEMKRVWYLPASKRAHRLNSEAVREIHRLRMDMCQEWLRLCLPTGQISVGTMEKENVPVGEAYSPKDSPAMVAASGRLSCGSRDIKAPGDSCQ